MTTATRTDKFRQTLDRVLPRRRASEHPWGEFEIQRSIAEGIERWNRMLDEYLIQWGRRGGSLDEDGVCSPSGNTISDAYRLGCAFREQHLAPPTHIVAGADGEIIFEFKIDEETFATCEVREDGSRELCLFAGGRVECTEFPYEPSE
jgi:hypothetical protein